MTIEPLVETAVLAYHDTQAAGGNLAILFVFIGVLATVGWVMFSRLEWRNTVMVAVAGWVAGLVVTFVL